MTGYENKSPEDEVTFQEHECIEANRVQLYDKLGRIKKNILYPELNRRITNKEYEELVDYAIKIGLENGFIQEGETALESFIPEFNEEGVQPQTYQNKEHKIIQKG